MTNAEKKQPILIVLLLSFLWNCAGSKNFSVPVPIPDDRMHIELPAERQIDLYVYSIDKLFAMPLRRKFEFARHGRKLAGNPKQAMNVDAFDEVSGSSWFTNRNAVKPLSLEEIARGPDKNMQQDPDQSGPWKIVRAKAEGITPGFTIEDISGDRYVIKFDPPGYSELATGAEVVCTKLFYAAGFNVPENNITYFRPDILVLGEKVRFTDKKGRKRFMNQKDLEEILNRIHYLPDGRIRALASKYLDGIPLGPFRYERTRRDDQNDIVPHEHRRELRGLRMICAWLNHFDTKAGNSFDGYVTENGRSFVKHYLMDFGSTLGSAAYGPVPPYVGAEYAVDVRQILVNYLSLGLYRYPFEKAQNTEVKYPSIGYYTSDYFHPRKYKAHMPNPAFLNMTNRDGFWAAKIIMSFTDDQLKTAVDQGKYSDPEASAYLLKTLIERRDITGRYWLERINPLDRFTIQETADRKQELRFVDLAVKYGFESANESKYRYCFKNTDNGKVIDEGILRSASIPLPEKHELLNSAQDSMNVKLHDIVWEMKIHTSCGPDEKRSKWIKVFMKHDKNTGDFNVLGLLREE